VAPVPFLDLNAQNQRIWSELEPAIQRVCEAGQFALGPAVAEFEERFAEYLGVPCCIGVNSGTSALHLALIACDVGLGDEVITTPLTWISTSWAVSYVGARPVFVDIDPETYNLDPARVESAISPRTRAILPVHLYGQAADLSTLLEIADRHGLPLIEDAAQAHGARFHGKRVGSFGRAGCFSFYPSKNLGSFGEAGAIVTADEALAHRVRRLRDHAQQGRHRHVEIGYNARMEGLQGAVLAVKLGHLERWNDARAAVAQRYRQGLSNVAGIRLPRCEAFESHVWHQFVVLVDGDRDSFRRRLSEAGVGTTVHYPTPIHLQPAYLHLDHEPGDFPVAEDVARRCVSLPIYPELERAQVDQVIAAVRVACGRHAP
jgi:dTDP-4-amino-4,6-dideoxygalactose transaminase